MISPHLRLGAEPLSSQSKRGVTPIPKAPREPKPSNPYSTLNRVSRKRRQQREEAHYTYALVPQDPPTCALKEFDLKGRNCDGPIDHCHLISKAALKRAGRADLIPDPRVWVFGCRRHHDSLDRFFTVVIPRDKLPIGLEALAEEIGLGSELDRRFGERRDSAPSSDAGADTIQTVCRGPEPDGRGSKEHQALDLEDAERVAPVGNPRGAVSSLPGEREEVTA